MQLLKLLVKLGELRDSPTPNSRTSTSRMVKAARHVTLHNCLSKVLYLQGLQIFTPPHTPKPHPAKLDER